MAETALPTTFNIDEKECIGCGLCVDACPMKVLAVDDGLCFMTDDVKCIECGTCYHACPEGAISIGSASVALKKRSKKSKYIQQQNPGKHLQSTPILDQLMDLLAEVNPVQEYSWQGKDIRPFDRFTIDAGSQSYTRLYRAEKLEKIGVARLDFCGLMTANVVTVAPGPEYDLPYYGLDWDESEDHIFFYCDLLPADDLIRNSAYLHKYLYCPLEDYYQTYCTMPGLKNSCFHWARAMYSPYVLTGTIEKANTGALEMLYSCTVDYLRAWIQLWKSASPYDPDSEYMQRVQHKRRCISGILHENDPGGPPLNKFLGKNNARTILGVVLP